MISTAKIVSVSDGIPIDYAKNTRPSIDHQYVEVIFDDGTFVALSEEELRNAAALAEKGCLS
jgi:hypothetical protein